MQLTRSPTHQIGIDLGGTKIEVVLLADQTVCWRRRFATPQGDYVATLQAIEHSLKQLSEELTFTANMPVGIGTPGTLDQQGNIKNANSTCLNGKPFLDDAMGFLKRPVRIANDANCFALAEATMGAAANAKSVFGVIIGTGVGGGVVVNGHCLGGANGIAGEWGHNRLTEGSASGQGNGEQRSCYCGSTDCIETYLSGPGLTNTYASLSGQLLSPPEIVDRLGQDTHADEAWQQYVQQFASSISQVMNIVDPEVIVVGGGLSNIHALYSDVPKVWQQWVFSNTINTRLLPATLGDSAGVLGAAWLWAD